MDTQLYRRPGYSFYDCLHQFGLEWFGRRSFFDQQEETGQALWMDLALARQSGQELNNSYILTTSPAFGPLRKFFRAAVRDIQFAYDAFPGASVAPATHRSICNTMRQDIVEGPQGAPQSYYVDPAVDIPVIKSLSPLIVSSTTPSPVVDAPVRSITPNNRSLCYMQSDPTDQPQLQVPLSRGAVSSVSLGSTDFCNTLNLWMDLALARQSGQELNNSYILTTSPAFGPLRKFFRAAVRDIQFAYDAFPGASVAPATHRSICNTMRQDIVEGPQDLEGVRLSLLLLCFYITCPVIGYYGLFLFLYPFLVLMTQLPLIVIHTV